MTDADRIRANVPDLTNPNVRQAVHKVLGEMWRSAGGDTLRWYGVYDPVLGAYDAFFYDGDIARHYVDGVRLPPGETPLEVRELELADAVAELIASHRVRVQTALSFGQKLKRGDLNLPQEGNNNDGGH